MNEETGEATMSTMADLVDDFEFKPLKSGETATGIIVSISSSEILVDVGAKSEVSSFSARWSAMSRAVRREL